MKRSLLATLWIGALAAALVIFLQERGLLHHQEVQLDRWIYGQPNETFGAGNYFLVVGLGFAVAWTMVQVPELIRRAGLLLFLVAELLGAAWVLSLAGIYFQPVPGIVVAVLAALLAVGAGLSGAARGRRATRELFAGRLSEAEISRLTERGGPDLSAPGSHEVTFVYCEIGNQADLIDEMSPADFAGLTGKLGQEAREIFLRECGYLQAAGGDGIRVLFGYPNPSGNHAAAAARAALAFRERIAELAEKEPDSLGKVQLRLGISSGPVVASGLEETRGEVVISGEPIELARRLAIANQIYGSQILLGPRAFSSAGAEIVARPLDFLRSSEAHERLEVYELLALAAEASPEEIACRDCFWTGLVYFRERRWSEAFNEFNRARRANAENDLPLQWYLHRLEPLILHMATEPAPVADPFSPL